MPFVVKKRNKSLIYYFCMSEYTKSIHSSDCSSIGFLGLLQTIRISRSLRSYRALSRLAAIASTTSNASPIITWCQMIFTNVSRSSMYQFGSASDKSALLNSMSPFLATQSTQTIRSSSLLYDISPLVSQ